MLSERGAVLIEAVFGVMLLVTVAIGVVQIGLFMFARNVVAGAAHEAARVTIERGSAPGEAERLAYDVVRSTTGRLVDDLVVTIATGAGRVRVRIVGRVDTLGPLPVSIPLVEEASARLLPDP